MPQPFPCKRVQSLEQFISAVKRDVRDWDLPSMVAPWFRGQPDASVPPKPTVFREGLSEHELSATFHRRAPSLGRTPQREAWDEWLFLMRHHGVPTRLLDWSEGALIALYFAVYTQPKTDPGVWLLHPLELNQQSIRQRVIPASSDKEFAQRVQLAFVGGDAGNLPIAILPTYIHERLRAQKASFTIHGKDTRDFEEMFAGTALVEHGYFRKYVFPNAEVGRILDDLKMIGITHTTIYPDLDGLATELNIAF